MTESVIHIKSPQLICFSCVIPTWGKKSIAVSIATEIVLKSGLVLGGRAAVR